MFSLRNSVCIIGFGVLALAHVFLSAQVPVKMPPAPAVPVLRTTTRVVPVDIVVTDDHGRAVHDLSQAEFLVSQDKKPQTVAHFHAYAGAHEADSAQSVVKDPPGVFTNMLELGGDGPINVLLLDTLNTPTTDQAVLRRQLINFLKTMQPGSRVAIFSLGLRLTLLQGFTSDTRLLLAVLGNATNSPSTLLEDKSAGYSSTSFPVDGNGIGLSLYLQDLASDAKLKSERTESRIRSTLIAFQQMSRFLAGFPGRKNLIWFSGSFPIAIAPDQRLNDAFESQASFGPQMRQIVEQLTRGQVAVYPIDARGLFTSTTLSAQKSGGEDYAAEKFRRAQDDSTFTHNEEQFHQQTTDENGTMLQVADATGGHAFLNTNDLSAAVRQAVELGSNYYSLDYVPPEMAQDGKYHAINVQLRHPGYRLSYRRGFYATTAASEGSYSSGGRSGKSGPAPAVFFQLALQHGAPASTEIHVRERITPLGSEPGGTSTDTLALGNASTGKVKPPYRNMEITYAIDPSTLASDSEVKHPLHLKAMAIIYNASGQACTYTATELTSVIAPDKLEAFLHSGVQIHQQISVPEKGEYYLRTAVQDMEHDRLGTIEVPVSLFGALPAVVLTQ